MSKLTSLPNEKEALITKSIRKLIIKLLILNEHIPQNIPKSFVLIFCL